jgi:uncharacterized membrane protein
MADMPAPTVPSRKFWKIQPSRIAILLGSGLIIGLWLSMTPEGLLGKADAVGYAVCHRIDVRSFHLGVRTLPMCARCSGTYLGVMLGLTYFSIVKKKAAQFPGKGILILLGLLTGIYALDGINSYFTLIPGVPNLYEPHNYLRLSTGMGFGIALISIVYPAFNQSLWKEPLALSSVGAFRELVLLILLGGGVVLAVISENPLILYPLAILSTFGVLILLTMVYTMVILIITKKESTASSWRELTFSLLGGFSLAILQVGLINLIRYLFMGTWEGFNFL